MEMVRAFGYFISTFAVFSDILIKKGIEVIEEYILRNWK